MFLRVFCGCLVIEQAHPQHHVQGADGVGHRLADAAVHVHHGIGIVLLMLGCTITVF